MRIGPTDTCAGVALVAEVGNNHEGSLALARVMVEEAFAAGADAVKLQSFVPELYVSAQQAERLETLRRYALPADDVSALIGEYQSRGLCLFSTPFDLVSLERLASAAIIKVSSGDLTYTQLVEAAARTLKPLILSTGAATLAEVATAVGLVDSVWRQERVVGELAVLHCVSAYPAPREAANLRSIRTLAAALPHVVVGYSDHSTGCETALVAAAAGARVIEKHFTLSRGQSSFRDHELSATPREFAVLRDRLRDLDVVLGDGVKQPHAAERGNIDAIRRSLTAVRDLPVGHVLAPSDLCVVRPGGGLTPDRLGSVVGRRLARPLLAGSSLEEGDLA